MNDERWYLVCYDVREPRRLRQTAKLMEGFGERVQYSVFRCWLTTRRMEQMRWELTKLLEPEDDVIVIPLCSRCVGGIKVTHETIKRPDWPDQPVGHEIV